MSAASVPTCTSRRTPASRQASITFRGAAHVEPLEVGRVAPVLDLRRGVEGHLAAVGARAQRLAVVEVAAHRLRAELAHALPRRAPSARARARPSPRAEALYESASDEA